jgi:hypothetical protein
MPRNYENQSELEREFELDMGEVSEFEIDADEESEADVEGEAADDEFEAEDLQDEFEADLGNSEFDGDYAERLYEISQREFEGPEEAAEAFDGVLNEMYENFLGLGKVKNYLKKKGKKLLKAGLKTGLGVLSKHPAFGLVKNVLAGKNLTQILTSLAQTAAAGTPIGATLMPALKTLGFPGATPAEQKEAWNNFVEVAREAYVDLADNLSEAADQPFEATQVATQSLKRGLQRVVARRRSGAGRNGAERDRTIRIRVRPGQRIRLVIIGQ